MQIHQPYTEMNPPIHSYLLPMTEWLRDLQRTHAPQGTGITVGLVFCEWTIAQCSNLGLVTCWSFLELASYKICMIKTNKHKLWPLSSVRIHSHAKQSLPCPFRSKNTLKADLITMDCPSGVQHILYLAVFVAYQILRIKWTTIRVKNELTSFTRCFENHLPSDKCCCGLGLMTNATEDGIASMKLSLLKLPRVDWPAWSCRRECYSGLGRCLEWEGPWGESTEEGDPLIHLVLSLLNRSTEDADSPH